ncbi:MAG: hypothetical protein EOS38_28760 [Mesorhizobium sp.]|nr:hypothetical protein EOA38_31610 [Mesorhizobium sp. M1E.F.Ca.ET.041.01.1.1]RWD81409.1 MAG: hypothetical protein EOS38_28760 [Mesorhizobium sp.]
MITGEISSEKLISAACAAHDEFNPRINAVIEFYEDSETVAGSNNGFFQGVPFLRKDLGHTEAGRLQEQGSLPFEGHRSSLRHRKRLLSSCPRCQPAHHRQDGNAKIDGRETESVRHDVTRDPRDLSCTVGGTSGGAAAVAAAITPIARGNDSGASIRGHRRD